MSTPNLPPTRDWVIWDQTLPIPYRLTVYRDPVILKAFDALRDWLILNDHALATLTSLTFDDDIPPDTTIFLERKVDIVSWLCKAPPRIDFVELHHFGYSACPSISSTPFFARPTVDQQQAVRIQLAAWFLQAINLLNASQSHAPADSQLYMVLFLLERTLMREIAHAARSIFSTRPSSPEHLYGLHIQVEHTQTRKPDSGIETHQAPDDSGKLVKPGEHGWEMEARTGGEASLYMSGEGGIHNLEGFHIQGLAIETRDSLRYLDVTETKLLRKLAAVDWDSMEADLARLPSAVPQDNKYSVLRGGDFTVSCGSWADEQQDHNEHDAEGPVPLSPSPSTCTSFTGLQLSHPADNDGDEMSDVEGQKRVKEEERVFFGKDGTKLYKLERMYGQDVGEDLFSF
ncbi:hypothetical protein GGX14DRAFT_564075 [Mycena pura]|uniref:Uncharacterized protein n=1 Tax=Mycena pura TaxID=153505 RepID=A0AAD6VLE6_9AGAR|nr:hypothetical protein GGX14DRAFT_564075 [Mycena pura]